jgi:hypothetical protein
MIGVDSVPEGASLYLDGIYKGKTPKLLNDVIKGYHQIKLSLDGYNDWSYTTMVTAGVTSNVKATLTSAPTSTIQTPGAGF